MTRFDPFREMDRLIADLRIPVGTGWPAMDVYRDQESYVARIDLPGVDPHSIDVEVEGRALTVRATRTGAPEGVRWVSRERGAGTVARQLRLGASVALDRIEADYRDGVLTLRLPVAQESRARKITVAHGAAVKGRDEPAAPVS